MVDEQIHKGLPSASVIIFVCFHAVYNSVLVKVRATIKLVLG